MSHDERTEEQTAASAEADAASATVTDPPIRRMPSVSMVSLVNDRSMHQCAVTASRAAARHSGIDLQPIAVDCDARGWNAARGLNTGIAAAKHRWVLCTHQDVLLPPTWFDRAEASLQALSTERGSPAIWGTVGTQASGRFVGAVRDPNGFCRWGRPPSRVISLDEHLILVDQEAGLRFDPRVPGFHCYGTDIAIRARLAGRDAAVLDAPVVHLSSGRIDPAFDESSRWMLRRWGAMFDHVIPTPAATIQRETATNAVRRRLVATRRRVARRTRTLGVRPYAIPRTVRDELTRSIAGLPRPLIDRLRSPAA